MSKKYLVNDPEDADRIYTKAVHGFDFKLSKGKTEEVNAKELALLKAVSPFLTFTEIKKDKEEETVFGIPVKQGKPVKPTEPKVEETELGGYGKRRGRKKK